MTSLPTVLPTVWLSSGLLACVLDADAAFPPWVLWYDICLGPFALGIIAFTPGKTGTGKRSEPLVMGLIFVFAWMVFGLGMMSI